MNLLAIETSVPAATLCLHQGERGMTVRRSWTAERNHDAWLFPALQEAMDALGEEALDAILIGAGPGSYGGVRVALAAGVGIAAVTGAPLISLCSWEQLAAGDACIISDARRGGWTVRRPDGTIEVLTPEELQALAAAGTPLLSTEAAGALGKLGITPAAEALVPTAEGLVQTWLSMTEEARAEAAAKPAEPIYVRPPHITAAVHKPWEIRK